jgi:glycogen phosphorylase/synthase
VYHLNEGHSAFLLLERIAALMGEAGLSFDEAKEAVRSNTVFTTHTPVDAGNEQFARDIMEYYFSSFVHRLGITWAQFWELGRKESGDDKPFYLTLLGLKLSHGSNAVSRMHGAVSRHMWQAVWKGFHHSDVPIRHITNGVHTPSFVAPRINDLLQTYVGPDWTAHVAEAKRWRRVQDIPSAQLWQARSSLKQDLVNLIRENVHQQGLRAGDSRAAREETLAKINPSALIIGFARRFAPYKRADLLLYDLNRLDRLVNDPKHPVMIVFGGKAHPNDGLGIELVKKVIDVCNDPRFRGKLFFLTDYDLHIAPTLLRGSDVWLNTPVRLHEASGTSGMKAAINGALNLSVADGWWCEGYNGLNGWTIGPAVTEFNADLQSPSDADSLSLCGLLNDVVVPMFYDRDEADIPHKWITMIKHSMETVIPRFSAARMLQEYYDTLYLPSAELGEQVAQRNFDLARGLADWKRKVPMRFSSLRLVDVSIQGIQGDTITVGTPFTVTVRVDPGKMDPAEILVELMIGKKNGTDFAGTPECVRLTQASSQSGLLTFSAEYSVTENGPYAYGIRVLPFTPSLACKQEAELVLWG